MQYTSEYSFTLCKKLYDLPILYFRRTYLNSLASNSLNGIFDGIKFVCRFGCLQKSLAGRPKHNLSSVYAVRYGHRLLGVGSKDGELLHDFTNDSGVARATADAKLNDK